MVLGGRADQCESDGTSYPVYCNDAAGLPEAAVVVDDVPGGAPSPRVAPTETVARSGGSFRMSFAGAGDGTYPSKVDLHQVGGGYGGHYWCGHTRTARHNGGKLRVGATWRLDGRRPDPARAGQPVPRLHRLRVFVPEYGAWTEQADYMINLGDGRDPAPRDQPDLEAEHVGGPGRVQLHGGGPASR